MIPQDDANGLTPYPMPHGGWKITEAPQPRDGAGQARGCLPPRLHWGAMSTTVRPSASQNTSAPGNRGHAAPALSGVLRAAARDSKLKGLVTHVGAAQLAIQGPDAVWPFAVGTIAQHAPVLVITATARQAEDLTEQLKAMLGDEVELMPAWETLPHERISPNVEIGRAHV